MKKITILTLMCISFGAVASTSPVQALRDRPISMLDFGIYKLERFLQHSAKDNEFTSIIQQDEIIDIYTQRKIDREIGKKEFSDSCINDIADIKAKLIYDPKTHKSKALSSFFQSHSLNTNSELPDGTLKNLEDNFIVTSEIIDKSGKSVSCTNSFNTNDVIFSE